MNWGDTVGGGHCAGGGVGGLGNDYDECARCQILNLFISDTALLSYCKEALFIFMYNVLNYVYIISYLSCASFYALFAYSCPLTMHTNW